MGDHPVPPPTLSQLPIVLSPVAEAVAVVTIEAVSEDLVGLELLLLAVESAILLLKDDLVARLLVQLLELLLVSDLVLLAESIGANLVLLYELWDRGRGRWCKGAG